MKMSTGYYQKNKKKLRKEAREKYQNISEEEKKSHLYHRERHKNICEDEKQKISEIKKKLSNI